MRKLTVSTLRRQWGSVYRTRSDIVPALRLSGNWLAEAGFTPGQKVRVIVEERALKIETDGAP
jgi:hypothetical protein